MSVDSIERYKRKLVLEELEQRARRAAIQILTEDPEKFSNLYYHGVAHTTYYVYPEAKALASVEFQDEENGDESLLLVAIAALFHDTGFATRYENNEEIGAENAANFVVRSGSDLLREKAHIIANAIYSTDMKSPPQNLVEKVIRDADLSALGKREFVGLSHNLQRESQLYPKSPLHLSSLDDDKWNEAQLHFIEPKTWFTQAAVDRYSAQQRRNVDLLKSRVRA